MLSCFSFLKGFASVLGPSIPAESLSSFAHSSRGYTIQAAQEARVTGVSGLARRVADVKAVLDAEDSREVKFEAIEPQCSGNHTLLRGGLSRPFYDVAVLTIVNRTGTMRDLVLLTVHGDAVHASVEMGKDHVFSVDQTFFALSA